MRHSTFYILHSTLAAAAATALTLAAAPTPPVPPLAPPTEIAAALAAHTRAILITNSWIRDPYITLGPDGYYYLTGTTPDENDPREQTDPYNTGLGPGSVVGPSVRLWRSPDLVNWEYRGKIFTIPDDSNRNPTAGKTVEKKGKTKVKPAPGKVVLWAPELHWLPAQNRWALVHCPSAASNFVVGPVGEKEPKGPWTHPLGDKAVSTHDPSIFPDTDGTVWLVYNPKMKTFLTAPLNKTLTDYAAKPTQLDPSDTRTDPDGETLRRIGHEGSTILKIGAKYVFIGTAWSTDGSRKGSYNLYYATADKVTGPYGPRQFLGRFLGHGTPFQDKQGRWWCTGFYNANVPPLPREGIEKRDLSTDAQTINQRGLTLIPLDVQTLPDGDIRIRATDPAYGTPGPDEVQKF